MILDELANHARERVARAREEHPLEEIAEQARALPTAGRAFEAALGRPGLSFICEVKRASPSKGIIAEDFPYLDIARAYDEAGADCLSVLTEPKWFLGSDAVFAEIRAETARPMIRKDFTVDAYQIYEAKLLGADAVLLICALLDAPTLTGCLELCDELGLSALVEAHDEREAAQAAAAGARLIGVNNRNLKDFTVDLGNAARLREGAPDGTVFVAESGVSAPADAAALRKTGADAVLVGEYLMRAADKKQALDALREAVK